MVLTFRDELFLFSNNHSSQESSPPEHIKPRLKIAIDGPAGAGKSTAARMVADRLGYLYLDTGAMYRAATWLVVNKGIPLDDCAAVAQAVKEATIELKAGQSDGRKMQVFVNGCDVTAEIRSQEISRLVSPVSAISAVRRHLVKQQREAAKNAGIVLDGRDIGTVVLPDADVKIFLTASPEVRAGRRLAELQAAGAKVDFDTILKEIVERDRYDTNRKIAPLRMAEDSVLILTDNMTPEEVVSHIVKLCS